MRVVFSLAIVAGAVLSPVPASAGGGGCHGGFSEGAGETVEMIRSCFTPTVLRVEPGTVVTFVNRDAYMHTLDGVAGTFGRSVGDVGQGEEVAVPFDREGVFPYFCVYHPGMVGAVVVGDGAAADVDARPQRPVSTGAGDQELRADTGGVAVPAAAGVGVLAGVGLGAGFGVLRRRHAGA